jgi:hypothetical protein
VVEAPRHREAERGERDGGEGERGDEERPVDGRPREPAAGARKRKSAAWVSATDADPSAFPTASAARDPGAAWTDWRKPRWRSSMTDAVVKMEAKRTTIMRTPG